jgi:TPR repeat protein
MRKLTATLCLTLAVLLGSAGMSASADLQQGYAAYESGDYVNALHVFRSLSEKGNADAQTMLGWMYAYGVEIPKDYTYAYMWGKISASNRGKNGSSVRNTAAEFMTPAEISTAQKLTEECIRKKYKGC